MIVSSGLQFAYGNGARLHFPAVDVPQGGVLLLGGPSGSGKSTWLALAAGLVAPSGGSLQVAGQMLGALGTLKTDAWRAQTIGFDDFVTLGGEVAAKEAGKARDEGKEYVVKDGDVMLFKFNT